MAAVARQIVTNIPDLQQVRLLDLGTLVGDAVGGRSFSDNIAEALERRSHGGWQDVVHDDTQWTVILIEC